MLLVGRNFLVPIFLLGRTNGSIQDSFVIKLTNYFAELGDVLATGEEMQV